MIVDHWHSIWLPICSVSFPPDLQTLPLPAIRSSLWLLLHFSGCLMILLYLAQGLLLPALNPPHIALFLCQILSLTNVLYSGEWQICPQTEDCICDRVQSVCDHLGSVEWKEALFQQEAPINSLPDVPIGQPGKKKLHKYKGINLILFICIYIPLSLQGSKVVYREVLSCKHLVCVPEVVEQHGAQVVGHYGRKRKPNEAGLED